MTTWYGTSGNDYNNWTGDEQLFAYGGEGNDTIWGNTYDDFLMGESGNDSLLGYSGNDTLTGDRGNDTLLGESGNDSLVGGFSYDFFWGDSDQDLLTGGAGSDTFVIGDYYGQGYLGYSWAVIQDFNWHEDYIQVQGSLSQYQLRSGSQYGYSSNDTAIVLSSNPNEVLAVALGVSSYNDSIQLSTRDFITT